MVCYKDCLSGVPDPQRLMAEMAKGLAGDSAGTVVSEKVLPGKGAGPEVLLRTADQRRAVRPRRIDRPALLTGRVALPQR
jgi:hypothetical protein